MEQATGCISLPLIGLVLDCQVILLMHIQKALVIKKHFIINASSLICFSVPVKPKQSQMLTMNSTTVTIWLDSWGDGGCGISHFSIEYRVAQGGPWTVSSNQVQPTERIYSINDLMPATEYELRITAYNNGGETVAIYNFTTYNLRGGKWSKNIFALKKTLFIFSIFVYCFYKSLLRIWHVSLLNY